MAIGTKTFMVATLMAIVAVCGSIGASNATPLLEPRQVIYAD